MTEALEKNIFTLLWRIENFRMCPQKKGERISSPDFVVDALEKTTWHLKFYPKGDYLANDDQLSVFLHRSNKEEEPDEVTVEYDIRLITSNMTLVEVFNNSTPQTIAKGGSGFRELIARKRISEIKDIATPNDVLTLLCCIRRGTELSEKHPCKINVSAFLPTNTYFMEEVCSVISEGATSRKTGIEHCVFTTRIPVERRKIKWTIKDFKIEMQSAKKICVSVLSNLREKSELLLSCYLSKDCDNHDSVGIDIERKDKKFKQMFMRCKVIVLNKQGVSFTSKEQEHLFGGDHEVWFFPPVVKLNSIEKPNLEILDDDALKLLFEFLVSYKGEEVAIVRSSLQTNKSVGTDDLKQDLTNMLSEQELTDVTLISEEKEIWVHKSVICARSPVFRAMFTNETEEKRTGIVRITDVEADTLDNMIKFMYKDQLPELTVEDTKKLYLAADKYQLLKLKRECASMIKYRLSLSNVCDILLLADAYQDLELKASASNFLRCHSKEVLKSDEWNELKNNNLLLAVTLMEDMLI